MSIQQQKFNIKIPQDTIIIFSKKKQILTVKGPVATKSIKLQLKIEIDHKKKILSISPVFFSRTSNAKRKKITAVRATTIAQIKHLLVESSTTVFRKLKIIGVGYRIDSTDDLEKSLLTLKLGYSHFFHVRVPKNLNLNCLTKTKFSIFGNSYHEIAQLASKIREKKAPEPYKGKGILYENETITLKEGKKI